MCLTVKSELKTAKQDLYTIKKFNVDINKPNIFRSPYRRTCWDIKTLKRAKLAEKKCINDNVNAGLHSLIENTNYWFDRLYSCEVLMVCKIPKGSKYYIGENSDIVSNQLEIIETAWKHSKFSPFKGVNFKYASGKAFKFLKQKYGKQQY
jgi:hypothetical protein